jgi:hypothetical protein
LRLIEKSASGWQKTVSALEDEVTRLRRCLSENQTKLDIYDLRTYKSEKSRDALVRHLRYVAAGSKWRALSSVVLADVISCGQLAEMERMTARGTCYMHFKMWSSEARQSAQRRKLACGVLLLAHEAATRRLHRQFLHDWLRVASAGSVLFVGHFVRKTVKYVEGVR